MAKRKKAEPAVETPEYDENPKPDESIDDYMRRRDEEEAEWTGKQGGHGPSKHDANEHRHPKFSDDDDWDPHLGSL